MTIEITDEELELINEALAALATKRQEYDAREIGRYYATLVGDHDPGAKAFYQRIIDKHVRNLNEQMLPIRRLQVRFYRLCGGAE